MRNSHLIWLCLMLCVMAGCGGNHTNSPDLIPVTGTVTLKGKPAAEMDVIFYPSAGGAPSFAQTNEQGRFELTYNNGHPGAVAATHRVVISKATPATPIKATGEVPAAGSSKEWVQEVVISIGQPPIDLKLD